MIKLKYGQIRHPEFNPALAKLTKSPVPFKTARKIVALLRDIGYEQAKSDEDLKVILERYFEPDPDKAGMLRMREDTKEEALKDLKEFDETEVELNYSKVSHKDFSNVQLTANEFLLLENLIED